MVTMPKDFAKWYAAVEVGQAEKAAARWTGVDKVVSEARLDDVEALVRLAFRSRQKPDPAAINRIIDDLKGGDETFDPRIADREIQVLAAAALTMRLVPSHTVALALTTAGLDGARRPELPMDLFGMAENALREKAKVSRARAGISRLSPIKVNWSIPEDQAATMTMKATSESLMAALNGTLKSAAEEVNGIVGQVEHREKLADEELQMLWWLLGGHMSSGVAIEDVDLKARPFAIGHELASRTLVRPGPLAIPALLSRAGLERQTEIKVVDAVNAMEEAWVKDTVEGLPISPVTHPLHDALRRREETGTGPDWVKNWSAVCEVDPDYALPGLRLSELFYRERLLLTVLG